MKLALTLLLVTLCYNLANAQVYNNSLSVGPVTKGKMLTKTFTSIPLPASTFALEAIQINIIDETTKARFNHDALVVSAVDLTLGGKKIVSFTSSNILNPLFFPSPYALAINGPVDVSVSIFTNVATTDSLSVQYILKYSTSSNYVALTRTATSCVANYSSFVVPGTGGVFTVQNPITWQQNIDSMAFQVAGSQGILSMQIADSANNVVCKSNAVYKNGFLQSMTPCTTVVPLVKGTTYITSATYNNTKTLKGVFGNFGFYVGFPRPTTTASTHTTTGPAVSTHTTTGPATSSHSTTGGSSSGPSTGGHTGGSSAGGSSAGGSSAGGSSSEGSTSSNPTSSNPTSSQFTTTADSTSSNPTTASPTTASPTVSPTGYTVSTGAAAAYPAWEPARKIQVY